MTLDEAKLLVATSNPNALFVEDAKCKGYYHVLDSTYSDEVRAAVFNYDDVTGDLLDYEGNELKLFCPL